MKKWLRQNIIGISIVILVSVLLFQGLINMMINMRGNHASEGPGKTELHDVELAVSCVMADSEIPVVDLNEDDRIISYASCGAPLVIPGPDADDEEMEATGYTRNANVLIIVHPESEVHPLAYYLADSKFDNWYCLHSDGTVEGYIDEEPHTNIRDL